MTFCVRRFIPSIAVVVWLSTAHDACASIVLGVDFQHSTVVDTQPSFETFVIAAGSSGGSKTFGGGIDVTVSAVNVVFLDTRHRSVPPDSGSLTVSSLLRDKVFAFDKGGAGGIDRGLDVLVEGLRPFQSYELKIWSWDLLTGGQDHRASAWFANDETDPFIEYSFDATLPSSNDSHAFSTTLQASATGTLLFKGRRLDTSVNSAGEPDHGVFLNAFTLDAVPEPTSVVIHLLLGLTALVITAVRCASRYLQAQALR